MENIKEMDLWHYALWETFSEMVYTDTLNDACVMGNGAEQHQDSIFEINAGGITAEYDFETPEDHYFYKMQKDKHKYLLPKRYYDKLPLVPKSFVNVKLKKYESSVWRLVMSDYESFQIPEKKTMEPWEFIAKFNPIIHESIDTSILFKCVALSKGLKIALCGDYGCVDAKTEFMTQNGWKNISDYSEDDSVLQYNSDGTSEFVEPLKYINKSCNMMYEINTKGVSQALTPDHRFVYYSKKDNLMEQPAQNIINTHLKSKGGFKGKIKSCFNLKKEVGLNISTRDLRVVVAVIADGTFVSPWHYNTAIIKVKKEAKKERLRNLLDYAEIEFKESKYKDGYSSFRFKSPLFKKVFDFDFWKCNTQQLEIIADEVLHWDGNNKDEVYTSIKQSADFIQYVFSALGKRATITMCDRVGQTRGKYVRKSLEYTVHITKTEYSFMSSAKKECIKEIVPEGNRCYCFTVPSNMLVLRRNNRIFVTGNSGKNSSYNIKSAIQRNAISGMKNKTEAMFYKLCLFNDDINIDEVTTWNPQKIQAIEDKLATYGDQSTKDQKHALDSNKANEVIKNVTHKSFILTFNPYDEKKHPRYFGENMGNPGKIEDRYPFLYPTGKVVKAPSKPMNGTEEAIVTKNMDYYKEYASNFMYIRNNVHLLQHGYDRSKLSFDDVRKKDNIMPLIDVYDAISQSKEQFDYYINFINECRQRYWDMRNGHNVQTINTTEERI